jgi:hypothetical protein
MPNVVEYLRLGGEEWIRDDWLPLNLDRCRCWLIFRRPKRDSGPGLIERRLYEAPNGHWVEFVHELMEPWELEQLTGMDPNVIEYLQVTEERALALRDGIRPGCSDPPPEEDGAAPATPEGIEAAGPAAPPREDPPAVGPDASASKSPTPVELVELDNQIRRRWPRRRKQAALVEFMKDRDSASYLEVAKNVYDDDTTGGGAIEQLVLRTNETLVELGASFYFHSGGEYIFKDPIIVAEK